MNKFLMIVIGVVGVTSVAMVAKGMFNNKSALSKPSVVCFASVLRKDGTQTANAIVRISQGRILSIESGSCPEGESGVLNLGQYHGLPGLIDVHTHLSYICDDHAGTTCDDKFDDTIQLFLSQKAALRTLEAGVTTVRDLGSWNTTPNHVGNTVDLNMRLLINNGNMRGPRMLVSSFGIFSRKKAAEQGNETWPGVAQGVDEVRKAVRAQIAMGVDQVKMFASTGDHADVTGEPTFDVDEIRAAVEEAHQAGKKIAIHSYGPAAAKSALIAGADTIEHATDLDDALLDEFAKSKTIYVPTIDHNRYYIDNRKFYKLTDEQVQKMQEFIKGNAETVRRAFKKGVKIAMGSDAIELGYGQNAYELFQFAKIGMTPLEVLRTATTTAAQALGMENQIGALEPGFKADMIAVKADPLADVANVVYGVTWVLKDGEVMKSP